MLLAINPIHHYTEVGQCGWYACTPSPTEEQVITSVAHHSLAWRLINASRDKKCASSSVFNDVMVVGERMAMILLHSIASLIGSCH